MNQLPETQLHQESATDSGILDVIVGTIPHTPHLVSVRHYAVNNSFQDNDLCSVCLESLNSQAFVCQLTCGHDLHLGCAYRLKHNRHTACPICKKETSFDKDTLKHYTTTTAIITYNSTTHAILHTTCLSDYTTGKEACILARKLHPTIVTCSERPYLVSAIAHRQY